MNKATSVTLITISLIVCATITSTVYMLSKKESSAPTQENEKSSSIEDRVSNEKPIETAKEKFPDRPKLDIQYIASDKVDQFDAVCEYKSSATCELYLKSGTQSKLVYQVKDGIKEQTDEPGRSLVRWKLTRAVTAGSKEVFARTPELSTEEADSSISAIPITE